MYGFAFPSVFDCYGHPTSALTPGADVKDGVTGQHSGTSTDTWDPRPRLQLV